VTQNTEEELKLSRVTKHENMKPMKTGTHKEDKGNEVYSI